MPLTRREGTGVSPMGRHRCKNQVQWAEGESASPASFQHLSKGIAQSTLSPTIYEPHNGEMLHCGFP